MLIAWQRWILTAHERAGIASSCRTLAGLVEGSAEAHKETRPARLKRDEDDVRRMVDTICNWGNHIICNWGNPFDLTNDDLVTLASGKSATEKVKIELETAFERGRKTCTEFIESRLVNMTSSIFDKLPKQNLGTFASMS